MLAPIMRHNDFQSAQSCRKKVHKNRDQSDEQNHNVTAQLAGFVTQNKQIRCNTIPIESSCSLHMPISSEGTNEKGLQLEMLWE